MGFYWALPLLSFFISNSPLCVFIIVHGKDMHPFSNLLFIYNINSVKPTLKEISYHVTLFSVFVIMVSHLTHFWQHPRLLLHQHLRTKRKHLPTLPHPLAALKPQSGYVSFLIWFAHHLPLVETLATLLYADQTYHK